MRGPSPRGRGSRLHGDRSGLRHGSIPAWAGEPPLRDWPSCLARVHPRVGGGAIYAEELTDRVEGPSPRGRGSLMDGRLGDAEPRSIPAWAGEPAGTPRTRYRSWVHPRVGGGAALFVAPSGSWTGPSPRGRGSRARRLARPAPRRSIPAWAGEPCRTRPRRSWRRVHPRVGGGAGQIRKREGASEGPSPRGRGSLMDGRLGDAEPRSIPAWAGEPHSASRQRDSSRVHPRVGGGATIKSAQSQLFEGPSPRGRGSRRAHARTFAERGSIPAWAGEPPGGAAGVFVSEVHPRVGGGAYTVSTRTVFAIGPSPRGRGSRERRATDSGPTGSIPAWAGEPQGIPPTVFGT